MSSVLVYLGTISGLEQEVASAQLSLAIEEGEEEVELKRLPRLDVARLLEEGKEYVSEFERESCTAIKVLFDEIRVRSGCKFIVFPVYFPSILPIVAKRVNFFLAEVVARHSEHRARLGALSGQYLQALRAFDLLPGTRKVRRKSVFALPGGGSPAELREALRRGSLNGIFGFPGGVFLSSEERNMLVARYAAQRSNCRLEGIGCLIVTESGAVSLGIGGTPFGEKNCFEGGCPACGGAQPDESELPDQSKAVRVKNQDTDDRANEESPEKAKRGGLLDSEKKEKKGEKSSVSAKKESSLPCYCIHALPNACFNGPLGGDKVRDAFLSAFPCESCVQILAEKKTKRLFVLAPFVSERNSGRSIEGRIELLRERGIELFPIQPRQGVSLGSFAECFHDM